MTFRIRLIPAIWTILALLLLKATITSAASAPSPVLADELGGTQRYLAYVSTDKPIYRAGERVYLRTVVLNARDNMPFLPGNVEVRVKITGPKGDVVHEGYSHGTDSAVGYQWEVPAGMAGGQYTAKITSPALGLPEASRVFDIRSYRAPRMKTQIEFTRDGYGPGDQVRASVAIERAEGGVPQSALVTAVARLDGKEIYRSPGNHVTESGIVDAAFTLPVNIDVGEGSMAFVIEDGGIVETASKSLPIVLQKMDITFYPESGDLVAGLQSRVYFQALLPNGKPADVQGTIVEMIGGAPGTKAIAQFKSEHEGRGLFSLIPERGKRYAAVLTAPAGISHPAPLPEIKRTGTVIESKQSAYNFDDPIEFSITSNAANKPARLTLYKRETLLDSQDLITAIGRQQDNIETGRRKISSAALKLDAKDAEGVLMATVWDTNGRPLAERLVYRHPRFGLNIELSLSEGPFVPGGQVTVDVVTTDDNGNPVEAVVGLTVTDDTVLELIEKRQQAPRLPAMVYLENDVLDLADAHVYLDSNNSDAASAIDMLLGTQGWRRFVLVDYSELKKGHPLQVARVMAENSVEHQLLYKQLGRQEGVADAEVMFAAAVDMPAPVNAPEQNENENRVVEERNRIRADQQQNAAVDEADADQAMVADAERELAPAGMIVPERRKMARYRMDYVREFAFQARVNRKPNDRIDFTETLYWNSGVRTSARDGRASVSFSLSDSVTTFRVLADGYGRNGALGSGNTLIASLEPFYISVKMPLQAIAGDVIRLPVTMINTTDSALSKARLSVGGEGITAIKTAPISLAPGERLRSIIELAISSTGTHSITINSEAGPYSDNVTRALTVTAAGFPVSVNAGGVVSSQRPFTTTVAIPDDLIKGSLIATAKIYPSPLASMQEALNALLREPHGCFEQTSSTNYPLVMAQQYFDSHTGIDPALISKSHGLLKAGYSKLIGFESEDHGYEWFGANPAHEALTAYGLMEFADMAKVMQVDGKMIERTREWLLSRRDGKGGFKRNDRALDSFGNAPTITTNAYIVWALLESGQNPQSLKMEIDFIKSEAMLGDDSYVNALAANILFLSGDVTGAEVLAKKLAIAVDNEGAVVGATTSITRSGGTALTVETTSLALLAWLRGGDQWASQIETSIKWLFEKSKAGRFGSTQSTVLALKAINAYDAARAVPRAPGSVQLFIDGEAVGDSVSFTSRSKGAIVLPEFSKLLTAGQHHIEIRMADGAKMPFAFDISYNASLPVNSRAAPIQIATSLSQATIAEGEPLELQVAIAAGNNNVPSPIAIVGIPAGLELRHEQLKELVGANSISAYEVRDSELILYWRALKAGDTRQIPIGLVAEIPGEYTGAASRVYPYYTDEQKSWVAGHAVEVVAR